MPNVKITDLPEDTTPADLSALEIATAAMSGGTTTYTSRKMLLSTAASYVIGKLNALLDATPLTLARGGTGGNSAATARSNLGLGTLATQSGTFSGTSSGTNTGDRPSDVQVFMASGTWTKPVGAKIVRIIAEGGGGGGGGGPKVAASTAASGGAGGGGGGVSDVTVVADVITDATVAVTVGTAGMGGAGATAVGPGQNGTSGGISIFGSTASLAWFVQANSGGGGGYGSAGAVSGGGSGTTGWRYGGSSANGPAPGNIGNGPGGAGAAPTHGRIDIGTYGGSGTSATGVAANGSLASGAGGGAGAGGGGFDAANTQRSGGSVSGLFSTADHFAGPAGGGNGFTSPRLNYNGNGGSGGGSSVSTNGGNGGAGQERSAGGGGGGASQSGNGGNGGNGAPGRVTIITSF